MSVKATRCEEIRLTPEDKAIFRRLRRITRGAVILHPDDRRADCARADRRDAALMLTRQWPYQTYLPRGVRS